MGITRRKIRSGRKRLSNRLLSRMNRTRRKKPRNNFKTSKIDINFDGDKFEGRGNWISASSSQVYISYHGPKNSGRVYAPPKNYKDVEFYDKDNKVSLTWSGDWYDEDKKKYIFRNKKFTIKFPKDKDYINFKDLFYKHPQKKQKTLKNKRPSPSISATKFKVGTTKKGNDGNKWIVKENKKGVKRWVKTHKKSH